MINAREELVEHIAGREVDLVRIVFRREKIEGSLDEVLPQLDFEYYAGLGIQELYGYVWYADGTWSERAEHSGSEWWVHKERPEKNVKIEQAL